MMELLNIDELAKIAAATPYDADHSSLLSAFCTRYPQSEFIFVSAHDEWSYGRYGLLDADGNKISDDFAQWVTSEYENAGKDARKVWEKYKDAGMVLTVVRCTTVYMAVPYVSDPDGFIQIEVDAKHEVTDRYAFDNWSPPESLDDLKTPFTGIAEETEINPWRYEIRKMTDIRRFVRDMVAAYRAERMAKLPEMERKVIRTTEITTGPLKGDGFPEIHQESHEIPFLEMFPNWVEAEHPGARLLRDWQESSAGKSGHRFCEHWLLQLHDYVDNEGVRDMGFTPQWADADGGLDLPEIHPDDEASPYGVMESLSQFDRQAGYPFAWYFYMLHGNRIIYTAGSVVAGGIKDGKLRLPEHDEKVLMRWYERQYGF